MQTQTRLTQSAITPARSNSSKRVASAATFLLLALCGCQRSFYATHGTVQSDGGPLGQWSLPPEGCSLAPFDGLPVSASSSLVEFAWRRGRPGYWSPEGPEDRWAQGPESLEISHAPNPTTAPTQTTPSSGITASFKLVQTGPALQLNASTCKQLRLDTHPGPPVIPGAPASLAGHLVFDCTLNGSHLTANLHFRGCVL